MSCNNDITKSIEAFQMKPCVETEEKMIEYLQHAQFFLPTIVDSEPVMDNTKHTFSIWQSGEGINYLPVFTDKSLIEKSKDKAQYVRQQKGHSLTKHVLLIFVGVSMFTIPCYSLSPNHYWQPSYK